MGRRRAANFSATDVRDKSIAVAAYAKQAEDKELELNARELRLRAERCLGQLIAEMPKAKGGWESRGVNSTLQEELSLADVGIDKNLAKSARVAASMGDDEFEEIIEEHRERGEVVTSNARFGDSLLRLELFLGCFRRNRGHQIDPNARFDGKVRSWFRHFDCGADFGSNELP